MAMEGIREGNQIRGKHFRFTVLTERLLRLEYSEKGCFVDGKSQMAVNRSFPPAEFHWEEGKQGEGILRTKYLRLIYKGGAFSSENLRIFVSGDAGNTSALWHYGDKIESLKGTARTLDAIDGALPLSEGIVSRQLFSVLDDSKSMLYKDGNFFVREDPEAIDLYFFAYGTDYKTALKDFFHLTGDVPLLPRYTLGNWWSRYFVYSEESYLELMDRFQEENIPFQVAVIDMDWHITKVPEKYGTGWTGYSWNKDLFPDPPRFLKALKDRGMACTLNVHPADGVRAFEDCYPAFAEFMGVNQKEEEPVLFDLLDEKFREGYFRFVHHPMEKDGVDFWWIDWQQGENSGMKGLDPLWMLNHYHYEDNKGKNGEKRSLILSRYAGPGSHRYPIGFSGDTVISWESLDFQPYFTATASNIGYGWWSHDIGGHMWGVRDDSLFTRWVQLGVFSPIMRLHSTNNAFNGKEPWKYSRDAEAVSKNFLRLRKALVPYLYTMNYLAHVERRPLILPLYYEEKPWDGLYDYKNEYYFGTELLCAPITEKEDPVSGLGKVKAWLPEGRWVDFFTGEKLTGGRELELYRSLESIPVLAKEGTILPLDGREEGNAVDAPELMELHIFSGADGSFCLAEDEHEYADFRKEDWAFTRFSLRHESKGGSVEEVLHIFPVEGNENAFPKERLFLLHLRGVSALEGLSLTYGDSELPAEAGDYLEEEDALLLSLPAWDGKESICLRYRYNQEKREAQENKLLQDRAFTLLQNAQISYDEKTRIFECFKDLGKKTRAEILGAVHSRCTSESLRGALVELLSASGV